MCIVMSSGPWMFKTTDLKRDVKALHDLGYALLQFTRTEDGYTVTTHKAGEVTEGTEKAVADLSPDDELARWRRKKNAR
jgi:hypothetical protein